MVILTTRHMTDTNRTKPNPRVLEGLLVCLFFPLTVVLNLPADPASFAS